jgi:prepilin-type N-terminal cleavage/methylation domain-containing protein
MEERDQRGFTLVELLVVVAVLGIILSAVAGSLIVVVRTTGATAHRLSQSHDAQLLSTWLVPDLQSAVGPVGLVGSARIALKAPDPSLQVGACPAGAQRFGELHLAWNDAATNIAYSAIYAIDTTRWALTRTFTVTPPAGTPSSGSFVVVHNLEDPRPFPVGPAVASGTERYPACFLQTGSKMTVTVTTLVTGEENKGSVPYSFDVIAQTRTPFGPAPVPSVSPPALISLLSQDIAPRDGIVDTVVATFDQLVGCTTSSCNPSNWTVVGQPGTSGPVTNVVTSANTAAISLTPSTTVDTAAASMTVSLNSGSLVWASGAVTLPPTPVLDGMPPLLVGASSMDTGGGPAGAPDGKLDGLRLTFSEPLNDRPREQDFALTGAPAGSAIALSATSVAGSGTTYTLPALPASVVDTVAAGMRLVIAPAVASDAVNNRSPRADVAVSDGMAPVIDPLVKPIARDIDENGKADRLVLQFSEPLGPTVTASQFSLTSAPSSAMVSSGVTSGPTATLTLNEGGGLQNTTTAGFTVAASSDPNGLRDGAGNLTAFSAQAVVDGMAPVLVALGTPADGTGTVAGQIEDGDTLDVVFSEAPASVAATLTMAVQNGVDPGTSFSVPGLISAFTVGPAAHYSTNKADCTLSTSSPPLTAPAAPLGTPPSWVVRLTLLSCTAVGTLEVAAADAGSATIAPGLADAFGNAASASQPPAALPMATYF